MSRIGISYDDVLEAITSIEKLGDTPTIDKVRVFLGETGSNSTISKYLRQYRSKVYSNIYIHSNKKTSTPDIVQQAVERVWQDMREQTDNEILSVKTEAQKLADEAVSRAHVAETNLNELKLKYDQLFESYQTERTEKELLLLDIKKLREEHSLLQERSKALETRYAEMQSLTSQHLIDLSNAHKNEVARLEEAVRLQLENHVKFVDTIKEHGEQERHQYIVTLDSLKVENKKLNDHIEKLQSQLQNNFSHIKKVETDLKVLILERDEALNRLNDQDKKWSYFNDKLVISDEIINKIHDAPKWDHMLHNLNIIFEKSVDKKIFELSKNLKLINFSKFIKEEFKEEQDE